MYLRTQRISSMLWMFMVVRRTKKYEKNQEKKKNVMEKSINNWARTNLIITLKFFLHKNNDDQIKSDQKKTLKALTK